MKTRSVHSRINSGRTAKIQLDINRFVFSPRMSRENLPLTILAILEYGVPLNEALQLADRADTECADWMTDSYMSRMLWNW